MEKIELSSLNENVFNLLNKDWMLLTAGTPEKWNTMTVSWGSFGTLWFAPTATVYVRPTRYTLGFLDTNPSFTLSVLEPTDENRKRLMLCGTKSGRELDKAAATGLEPIATPAGNVTFAQARLVFECTKLYRGQFSSKGFMDSESYEKSYNVKNGEQPHYVFIGKISAAYKA